MYPLRKVENAEPLEVSRKDRWHIL